jgi:DNA/RNA endonuclease YhcR with UshA esterase domain
MKIQSFIFAAIFFVSSSIFAGTITPQEAKDHVGDVTTVTGSVDGFKSLPQETFLDMGGRYPANAFTVFVPIKSGISAAELQQFEGKVISVTGTIALYRGRPEIVLTSLNQISAK